MWGTWPLYARSDGPSGLVIGFLTMVVMALPAPFVLRRRDFADRGAVLALFIVGLADAGNVVLYFSAIARGPTVVAVLTHYLTPTLVAFAAPLILKEPRSRRALLASPIILLALASVLGASPGNDWSLTAALGAGSAVFYATLVVFSRRAGRTFSPLAVSSLHAVVSALTLLLVFGGDVLPTTFDSSMRFVAFGAIINGLLGAVLFNLSLRAIGAQLVGVITYLEPLTAAVIGIVILGEPFTRWTVIGGSIVLAAGIWAAREPTQRIALEPSAEP